MHFSVATVVVALLATAAASLNGTVVWVTTTTTALTTLCPSDTTLTYGDVTYTATASQVLTITNCPCTISHPVTVLPVTSLGSSSSKTSMAPYANITISKVTSIAGSKTTSSTTSTTSAFVFTGAGNDIAAGSAAGFAGFLGLAVLLF